MQVDESKGPDRVSRSGVIRFVFLVSLIIGTFLLFHFTGVGKYFTKESISNTIETIRVFESQFGAMGPVLFWALGAAAVILNVPSIFIIWLAVMTFGPVGGSILSILCLNTATFAIYFISRLLGREFVDKVFGKRFSGIEDRFEQAGFMTVIYLRLIFFMFPPLNWFLGLMNLKFRDFFLGTMLGTIHNIIINAWVAGIGIKIIQEGRSLLFWKSPELAPPLVIGLAIFIAVRIFDKRRQKRKAEGEEPSAS